MLRACRIPGYLFWDFSYEIFLEKRGHRVVSAMSGSFSDIKN